jgi:hypothetical protein
MNLLCHPKTLMQRCRALLHVIDGLVESGHKIFIYERDGKRGAKKKVSTRKEYNPLDYTEDPWDIDRVNLGTLRYLCKHFGLKVKHLNKINWLHMGSKINSQFILATDRIPFKTRKGTFKTQINLPYNEVYCRTFTKEMIVGNGMCEEICKQQKSIEEVKGQLLITHPGGGRDIVSPLRKHIPKQQIIANNINLINNVLRFFPKNITKVIMKAHPAAYINCDRKALVNFVKPALIRDVEIVDSNLIGHICRSEFVLTFGSSTIIWLLGSDKKWVNVFGCAQYNKNLKGTRDRRLLPYNWDAWPQNVTSDMSLYDLLVDYDNLLQESDLQDVLQKYREVHNMPCSQNIVDIINRGGK